MCLVKVPMSGSVCKQLHSGGFTQTIPAEIAGGLGHVLLKGLRNRIHSDVLHPTKVLKVSHRHQG